MDLLTAANLRKISQKPDTNTVGDSKSRGTTLVELMVAVGFLGVGAVALLTCVNTSIQRESYAHRRALILAAAQDRIDAVRSSASFGTFTTGSSLTAITVPGLQSQVTLTTVVTLQASYPDLYLVDVTAAWTEQPGVGLTRNDSLILDTFVRTNDT